MIIQQYGITLKRVESKDIELIRKWRNHPSIRKHMAFKTYITKKMQLNWFNSINNELNYYFLIEYQGKYIGVINAKKINLKEKSGEGGIFIWNNDIELAPICASLCLLNASFNSLNIFNKSYIQILKKNIKSIFYNKKIGYKLIPGQDNIKNQYYILTKEDYLANSKKLNIFLSKYSNDFEPPRITINSIENTLPNIINTLDQFE